MSDLTLEPPTKQPWVLLPPGVPAVPEFYDVATTWPADSLARRTALRARVPAPAPPPR